MLQLCLQLAPSTFCCYCPLYGEHGVFFCDFPMGKFSPSDFPMGNFFTFLFPPHSVLEIITRGKKINKCFNYTYNLHHPQFWVTGCDIEKSFFLLTFSPWGKFPHRISPWGTFHGNHSHFMSFGDNRTRQTK